MQIKQEEIVKEVRADFLHRQEKRRQKELKWRMNLSFLKGDQHCGYDYRGDIGTPSPRYSWECREVYNHIAPIIETRVAKLVKSRKKFTAPLAEAALGALIDRHNIYKLSDAAIMWAETCGTAFFKVTPCNAEGDIAVSVVSPFEIFPDTFHPVLEECASIIHAKVYPIGEIFAQWGVKARSGEDCAEGYATVIERYVRPTREEPQGRLTVVAGNALVYEGALPFNSYPFIKQTSIEMPDEFFGTSVIERLIPIQRAFNTVKNRKHEFMNRLAAGVLAVEDGTVDVEELQSTGLAPGSIIVYRQGAKRPEFLENANVPKDFREEEESLLYQFAVVSGVSDMMRSSSAPYNVTSGTALNLLLEQDYTRMSAIAEQCNNALKSVLQRCLALLGINCVVEEINGHA